MNKPISVITINLNNKDGLERTINSFLNQTMHGKVEYIVVDGESQDGSKDILEKYQSHIDIISIEKDKGIYDAMNRGIVLAKGDYTYFLNSGDEFKHTGVLERIIKIIELTDRKYNVIGGEVDMYRENGTFYSISDLYPWLPHPGTFVKSDRLKFYQFDESFKIYGDMDLFCRMKKADEYTVYYTGEIIANFYLGGRGNNPRNMLTQYQDRIYYSVKNNFFFQVPIVTVTFAVNFILYKLFGEQVFQEFNLKIKDIKVAVKKMIKW